MYNVDVKYFVQLSLPSMEYESLGKQHQQGMQVLALEQVCH